jgi:hypothetical protein
MKSKYSKMNPALKQLLEIAMECVMLPEKAAVRDAALDEILVKLAIRPIQMAWRSRTKKYHCDCCYNHDL